MDIYPRWRYHRTAKPRVVNDPVEEEALGAGWADTPAAFVEPETVEAEPEPAFVELETVEAEPEEPGPEQKKSRGRRK